ncbi:TPA: hypothetical protein ACVO40_002506 [Vibrio diabolicus]
MPNKTVNLDAFFIHYEHYKRAIYGYRWSPIQMEKNFRSNKKYIVGYH